MARFYSADKHHGMMRTPSPLWRNRAGGGLPDRPRRRRAAGWLALTIALAVTSGCGKHTSPAAPQPQPTNGTSPGAAAAQPESQPDLAELDRTLMRWLMGHRRAPKNFEEFAATAGANIPPPPAGKKYSIRKDMHIVLVDQ